jgi:CheY-like chemotaxis protein
MNKPKIVIADDDKAINNIYKTALESRGYEVYEAFDGIQALELVSKVHPDVLVDDVMMPGMNGLKLLDEVKRNKSTADIKVLILTALSDDEIKSEATAKGADDYIVKSELTFLDVLDRIGKLLQ